MRCGRPRDRRGPPGPAARSLLDVDRRHGTRHVRTDDRRQRLDDDGEQGCAALVAALGNVDRHDDGHDAAVRLTPGIVYGASVRRSAQGTTGRQIYALAAGYLIVWTVFSLVATALQRGLAALLLISPMMEVTSSRVGATLLLMAGLYQLTPMNTPVCGRASPRWDSW